MDGDRGEAEGGRGSGGSSPFGLRPARARDLEEVLGLLADVNLPGEGVAEAFEHFVVAEMQGAIVGTAGIELHGDVALLRSVAVRADVRGLGLGDALAAEALRLARSSGVTSVYLLTETAAEFFPRHGFRRIERSHAPPAIRDSAQFTGCCSTATLMTRSLGG